MGSPQEVLGIRLEWILNSVGFGWIRPDSVGFGQIGFRFGYSDLDSDSDSDSDSVKGFGFGFGDSPSDSVGFGQPSLFWTKSAEASGLRACRWSSLPE